MTLPSNIPTTEPAAIPSDPFACLAPDTAQAAAGIPAGASFDSVFSSQADGATITVTTDTAAPCRPSLPLVGGLPFMYPGMAYMTAPVVGSTPVAQVEIPEEVVEGEVQAVESQQTEADKTDDLPVSADVLAYQLIAGQWVQQPQVTTPVAKDSPRVSVAVSPHCKENAEVAALSTPGTEQRTSLVAPASIREYQPGKANNETLAFPATTKKEVSPARSVEVATVEASAVAKPQVPVPTPPASISAKIEANTPAPVSEAVATLVKNPLVEPATASAAEAGKPIENVMPAADFRAPSSGQEKIAAPSVASRVEAVSGVNTSNEVEEKKSLSVDAKKLKTAPVQVGTRGANREISMPYSAANKPSSAEFTPTQVVATSAGIQAGTTAPVAETSAPIAVQAPRLVEEIRAIADRISVIDRNSVEVRFDFSDSERLSVRVEYRDGTIHTTFRTDSSQLRDVISHEWQAQAVAAEQRSYRVADPVFNAPDTKQQSFSSLEDGSGRHRAFEQHAQSAAPSFAGHGRGAGSASTAAAPSPAARTETSRHLHTFA
jgi:hypothetical protein